MFNYTERWIALRFFFSKRKERFISINTAFSFIGIMLGVATLIIVMSVFNGFHKELVKRILGINSHITIYGYKDNLTNYQEIINSLKKMPEITSVSPIIDGKAMVIKDKQASAAIVRGIKYEDLLKKDLVKNNIFAGDLKDFQGKAKILIGDKLAYKLGVGVGDYISLISPQVNKSLFGLVPRIKDYKIVAIFSVGMHEYDSSAVFASFETAQFHFNSKDKASSLEIMTNDVNNTKPLADRLFRDLSAQGLKISVNDWQALNASFINAIKVEQSVMFVILTLIIIVAAFNIISSLIMLTNDKLKHIALLKTMGMSPNSITRIFFLNGALIGIIGTGFGVILGLLFSYNINSIKLWLESLTGTTLFDPLIYFLTDLPAEINISSVLIIATVSLLISFIAAIYPARKAAKLDPIEIINN